MVNKKAAKQFYVEEEAIYEAVAALTRKVPQHISGLLQERCIAHCCRLNHFFSNRCVTPEEEIQSTKGAFPISCRL